jgi:hypothetical protein
MRANMSLQPLNCYGRIIVNFNLVAYEEATSTLQEDFQVVNYKINRNARHIEAIAVIRQIEFALTQLELSVEEC